MTLIIIPHNFNPFLKANKKIQKGDFCSMDPTKETCYEHFWAQKFVVMTKKGAKHKSPIF
jgi:hypothetical protein